MDQRCLNRRSGHRRLSWVEQADDSRTAIPLLATAPSSILYQAASCVRAFSEDPQVASARFRDQFSSLVVDLKMTDSETQGCCLKNSRLGNSPDHLLPVMYLAGSQDLEKCLATDQAHCDSRLVRDCLRNQPTVMFWPSKSLVCEAACVVKRRCYCSKKCYCWPSSSARAASLAHLPQLGNPIRLESACPEKHPVTSFRYPPPTSSGSFEENAEILVERR